MKTSRNITGQTFGKLTALSIAYKKNGAYWNCKCECGNDTVVYVGKLTTGYTKSCGCLVGTTVKHGHSRTSEFGIWTNMKTRCYNVNHKWFHRYGGRGIVMCDSWRDSFEAFLNDMGPRPGPEYTIDRINNDGSYCKENCRWSTAREQQNNRSTNVHIEYFGVKLTLAEAGRISHLKESTIRRRLKRGWSINDAMSASLKQEQKGMI